MAYQTAMRRRPIASKNHSLCAISLNCTSNLIYSYDANTISSSSQNVWRKSLIEHIYIWGVFGIHDIRKNSKMFTEIYPFTRPHKIVFP